MDAQQKLFEVIELLEDVFGDDANVKAYLIDHLKMFASNDHGFLSNDLNIDKLIKSIKEEDCDWAVPYLKRH